ncbi:MAG TPA: CGNR zinc finger domain-containing protein [Ktedonobacteraceae bacterium]|nr:CGNR zinc finger domain-containing protein [Ktedonobacteraceae bacterium]
MSVPIPKFDDIPGNWLCLDFTHTLQDRNNTNRNELLHSYSDLLAWGLYMHILQEDEAQQLLRIAEQHPQIALEVLHNATSLREAMYRVFYTIAEDEMPQQDDMTLLNATLARAMSHACITGEEQDGFRWDWSANSDADRLERINWLLVRSAADLLTSDKLHDVRACAAEDCHWLFLDISKNHSRRWCDMETCGNQAKARRHYSRKKSVSSQS